VLRPCDRPVPLLGAGVSAGCGLPSGPQLADWIRERTSLATVDFTAIPPPQERNPLWVAQHVVDTDAALREPMMSELAQHLEDLEAGATLSPALLALAGTPNAAALILTLNYDLLIERAAEAGGRPAQTLGVPDIPQLLTDGLQDPDRTLRVLHLHGSLLDPAGELVLDAATYAERAGDQSVRELFRTLLAFYNLCIIGSSFEEQYLATVLQGLRPKVPRHVIVCDAPVADRIIEGNAELTTTMHNAQNAYRGGRAESRSATTRPMRQNSVGHWPRRHELPSVQRPDLDGCDHSVSRASRIVSGTAQRDDSAGRCSSERDRLRERGFSEQMHGPGTEGIDTIRQRAVHEAGYSGAIPQLCSTGHDVAAGRRERQLDNRCGFFGHEGRASRL
jgi:hypothetical protein